MLKILKFITNNVLLGRRLDAEKEEQKKEGYEIEDVFRGYENHLIYREGETELTAEVKKISDLTNDFKLLIKSYQFWNKPRSRKLTPDEYQKATERLVRYLSCWGGEVVLDEGPFGL